MRFSKILIGTLASLLTTPVIAIPVYWDMSFLDGDGDQVGNASFYYDDETQSRLITGGTTSPTTITNTTSEIEGFEGYLEGIGALKASKTHYWFDDSANLTAGSTVDGGGRNNPHYWFFNQHSEYIETIFQYEDRYELIIDFYDDANTLATTYDGNSVTGGSWSSQFLSEENWWLTDSLVGGAWTANKRISNITAVPVPTTLPLFGLGLAGLIWLSSRQRSPKNRNLNTA